MELKFIDLSGPVTVPAESAETVIKVATEKAPPRPASQIEITQTLDDRQLHLNGGLTLEIKAAATGLVPDLDPTSSISAPGNRAIAVKNVNPHEGSAGHRTEHLGGPGGRPFRTLVDDHARWRCSPRPRWPGRIPVSRRARSKTPR